MAEPAHARLAVAAPLAGITLPEGPGYRLRPWPLASIALAAWPDAAAADPLRASSRDSGPAMLRAREEGGRVLMRLGPQEVLIVTETEATTAGELEFLEENVIEISHGMLGLCVDGAHAAAVLAAGCPIDVHELAFPVGMATRTLIGKFEIILWRRSATEFRLLVARSSIFAFLVYADRVFRGAPPGSLA
ncbi:MAG: hypothetical protein CTY25_00915 [Methylobacterium sp.]|nr:MAG: hypothetical protein CTY25_00915 [Methylobacterium sp.]